MNTALSGFWSIVGKEVTQIRRDPTTLVFALMIPIIQLIMFGFAIDQDVRHIPTAVVDLDRTRESRAYVQQVQNTADWIFLTDSADDYYHTFSAMFESLVKAVDESS